jgi:hypothetical protein
MCCPCAATTATAPTHLITQYLILDIHTYVDKDAQGSSLIMLLEACIHVYICLDDKKVVMSMSASV